MKSAVAIWCALLSVGCSETVMSPTALPTNPATEFKLKLPEPAPAVEDTPLPVPGVTPPPHGAGATSARTLCAHVKNGVSCLVLAFTDDLATVRFTNRGTFNSEAVTLSAYTLGADVDRFASQRWVEHEPWLLQAGESVDLTVRFPPCNFQVDAYTGPPVNNPPHSDAILLGHEKNTRRGLCEPPPLTDCRSGVVNRRFLYLGDKAMATFDVLDGYEVKLWAAGYQREPESWDRQRLLELIPAKVYGVGTHSITVTASPTWFQGDVFCGPVIHGNVTPSNIDAFNALHGFFSFYVLSPA